MDVIFDLEKESTDWAAELNTELESLFPEFFATSPRIGSSAWWAALSPDILKGKITHVGPVIEDNERYDIVAIKALDEDLHGDEFGGNGQPEYSLLQEDYWLSEHVREGKFVQIESITLLPTGELDEHSIYIETKVTVW